MVGYTKGTWESLKCMHHLELSSRNSLFPFPSPGGLGLGLGLEGRSWRLRFFFFNGMVVGWEILLLVVLGDCLLFVWCSSAINGLYRVLGGDGDGG